VRCALPASHRDATCYDASFATLLDNCGVDSLLVVIRSHGHPGQSSTLPVTLEQVAYHTRCVARGVAHVLADRDMPFGSYQSGPAAASESAVKLMQAGAHMVKLEGGTWLAPTVPFLVERGIPVARISA